MIKNFDNFLNESLYDNISDKLSDNRKNVKNDILDAIEDSMNSSDIIDLQNWIGKFEKKDPNTVIDSLLDDSNLYDFYLKHQDDIDSILNEANWFDKTMSKLNLRSLYDITVGGSKEAIVLLVEQIKNELF